MNPGPQTLFPNAKILADERCGSGSYLVKGEELRRVQSLRIGAFALKTLLTLHKALQNTLRFASLHYKCFDWQSCFWPPRQYAPRAGDKAVNASTAAFCTVSSPDHTCTQNSAKQA